MSLFDTRSLAVAPDAIAPDGSEIRIVGRVPGASMAHGTLPPGGVSLAVAHRTIDEIWYVLDGEAEIWRAHGDDESIVAVRAGSSLTISAGTRFQFRTLRASPFRFIMCTSPAWPGDDEAYRVPGHWPAPRGSDV